MSRGTKNQGSFARGFLSVFGTAVVVLLATLAVALAVVPRVNNGAALTVLTGSMEPTFSPGDVIVVKGVQDADNEVAVGDVITFMPNPNDPTLITHRVVSKSINPTEGVSFITQGDANSAPDDPVLPKQIRGKFMYAVPYVGFATSWFSAKAPWLVTAVGVGLIAYCLFLLIHGKRRGKGEAEGSLAAGDASPVSTTAPQPVPPANLAAQQFVWTPPAPAAPAAAPAAPLFYTGAQVPAHAAPAASVACAVPAPPATYDPQAYRYDFPDSYVPAPVPASAPAPQSHRHGFPESYVPARVPAIAGYAPAAR
jgi:signal peptidase